MPSKVRKLLANMAAVVGPTKSHRRKIRQRILGPALATPVPVDLLQFTEQEVLARAQDFTFPADLMRSKRLMVIVVPEHNDMSGGIYSMFSIANQMHALRRVHGYDILVMTRPNNSNHTYIRLSAFRNAETVYRLEQLVLCPEVEDLYIHLPEYAAPLLVDSLSPRLMKYFLTRKKLFINILNQNIELMPEPEAYRDLRRICDDLTQSVAHHAYFSQEMADKYEIPTLLLPAYTDLTPFPVSTYEEKRKLIIYSKDEAPHKAACLAAVAEAFPDHELVEIRGITFDRYMQLATDCLFSISFGEGFDGYLAQPIYQGGIGLTAYNEEFFPSAHFQQYANIFTSGEDMEQNLVTTMKTLAADPQMYKTLNAQFKAEYDKLYSFEDYVAQIRKLALRQFELFPTKT